MEYPVSFKSVSTNIAYYKEVIQAHERASAYLKGFNWCNGIKNCALYLNLGATLCIFLFEIENSASSEDNFLWVVEGDIPPMYLDVYGSKTTIDVLKTYSALANDWISNVESGLSVEDCYPFDASPTAEMADMLKKRVVLIEKTIIPNVVIDESD